MDQKWAKEFNESVGRFCEAALQLARDMLAAFKRFVRTAFRTPEFKAFIQPIVLKDLDQIIQNDLVMRRVPGQPGVFSTILPPTEGEIRARRIVAHFLDDEPQDIDPEMIERTWERIKKHL